MATFEISNSSDGEEEIIPSSGTETVSETAEIPKYSLLEGQDFMDAVHYAGISNEENEEILGESLRAFLESSDISQDNLQYSSLNNRIIIYSQDGTETIIAFNHDSQEFYIPGESVNTALSEQREETVSQIESLSSKQRILEAVLDTMDQIFQNNADQWFGQRINDNDYIEINHGEFPWSELPELDNIDHVLLQDLLPVARRLLGEIQVDRSNIQQETGLEVFDETIVRFQEQYIDFVVGIGDIYEGGARAFHSHEYLEQGVTEEEIDSILSDMIQRKTLDECFQYMIEKHAQIEANNYQSTEVTRTYEAWTRIVNREVLNKMREQQVEDRYFLQYAKIVSGRDVPELAPAGHSLDSDLFDPESASEALLFVFDREGGILERIGNQITIEDPLMENLSEEEKKPSTITSNCIGLIEEKVEGVNEGQGAGLLSSTGFGNILVLPETATYNGNNENNGLNIAEKMQVSILLRLTKMLEERDNISLDDFGRLFLEIAEEGQNAIVSSINDNFDGGFLGFRSRDSDDFEGLSEMQGEILDLYNDIWGNGGIFDLSDNNWEWVRFGAQMGAVIIGSIAIGILAAPLVVGAAATVGVTLGASTALITSSALASVAVSRIVVPEGYDSNSEMALDLATDTVVALIFGLAGGILTRTTAQAFETAGGNILSRQGGIHIGANIIDIGILGIGTELARNYILRNNELVGDWSIQGENRFSYEDFHAYVSPEIRTYFQNQN